MTPSSSLSGTKGVRVHYFAQLLAEVLELAEGRAFVLDRICTEEIVGPTLVDPIRRLFEDLDGESLAEYLIGGVLKADLHPMSANCLRWESLEADDFLLSPFPNHLFQRDNSCWIYGGVSINPMAKLARQRETLHSRAIYRYHPMFANQSVHHLLRRRRPQSLTRLDRRRRRACDRQRHGDDRNGRADDPDGAEVLTRHLFSSGQARTVIAVELPKIRSMMHLDTAMTMIDRSTFVLYPYFDREARSWTITPGEGDGFKVSRNDNLWDTIAEALELDHVTVLAIDADIRGRRARAMGRRNQLPGRLSGRRFRL